MMGRNHRAVVAAAAIVAATASVVGAVVGARDVAATTPAGDPVVMAAGDIAKPGSSPDNRTAALLGPADAVLALGDEAYPDGTLGQFNQHYDPGWGDHRAKTFPVPGNHEWHTAGAAGYEAYFDQPDTHWYSFDLGQWHLVALESDCSRVGGCGSGSPQYAWLKADLARTTKPCILAYWHHPRYTPGGGAASVQGLWNLLYARRADVVLSGHVHNYQRWTQLNASGNPSSQGLRQFVVGTGGAGLSPFRQNDGRVERRNASSYGVLELVLRPDGYDWRFVPASGDTFTDSGSDGCNA